MPEIQGSVIVSEGGSRLDSAYTESSGKGRGIMRRWYQEAILGKAFISGSRMDYFYIGDYGKVACGWDMYSAKLSNGIARINSYGIYYYLDFDRVDSR